MLMQTCVAWLLLLKTGKEASRLMCMARWVYPRLIVKGRAEVEICSDGHVCHVSYSIRGCSLGENGEELLLHSEKGGFLRNQQ